MKPTPLGAAPGASAAAAAKDKDKQADPVKLAENAVAAAKAASMDQAMITQLEAVLDQRKKEASGSEADLSKRLTLATSWKGTCKATLDQAEERLIAAKTAAEEARTAHDKAAAAVQKLAEEVGKLRTRSQHPRPQSARASRYCSRSWGT